MIEQAQDTINPKTLNMTYTPTFGEWVPVFLYSYYTGKDVSVSSTMRENGMIITIGINSYGNGEHRIAKIAAVKEEIAQFCARWRDLGYEIDEEENFTYFV